MIMISKDLIQQYSSLAKALGSEITIADAEFAMQILEFSSHLEHRELKKSIAIQMLRETCSTEEVQQIVAQVETETFGRARFYDLPIEQLGLSSRAYYRLKRAHIDTVGDLAQKSDYELLRVRGIGVTLFKEIRTQLDWFCNNYPNVL